MQANNACIVRLVKFYKKRKTYGFHRNIMLDIKLLFIVSLLSNIIYLFSSQSVMDTYFEGSLKNSLNYIMKLNIIHLFIHLSLLINLFSSILYNTLNCN